MQFNVLKSTRFGRKGALEFVHSTERPATCTYVVVRAFQHTCAATGSGSIVVLMCRHVERERE